MDVVNAPKNMLLKTSRFNCDMLICFFVVVAFMLKGFVYLLRNVYMDGVQCIYVLLVWCVLVCL